MTTMNTSKVKILSAVICDDVRTEKNGKDLLIGVYSGAVIVHAIPSPPMSLRCWINLQMEGPTDVSLNFRVVDQNNDRIFFAQMNIGTQDEYGLGSIPLGPILYSLKEPEGLLRVDFKEGQGDWQNIMEKSTKYQSK